MKWICVTDKFNKFTYGKVYEGELQNKYLLNIPNDENNYHFPARCGYDGPGNFVEYFVDEERWQELRNKKINLILNSNYDIKFKINNI
jgi:hypothetical protein